MYHSISYHGIIYNIISYHTISYHFGLLTCRDLSSKTEGPPFDTKFPKDSLRFSGFPSAGSEVRKAAFLRL